MIYKKLIVPVTRILSSRETYMYYNKKTKQTSILKIINFKRK